MFEYRTPTRVSTDLRQGAGVGGGKTERDVAQSCGEILDRLDLLGRANTLAGSLTLLGACLDNQRFHSLP
jgi:hypothetical protein